MLSSLKKAALFTKKRLKTNPITVKILSNEYEQRFTTAQSANLFRGVFPSFDAAQASAPAGKPIGYDHPEPAQMYRDRASTVYPADYPVLYWLSQLLQNKHRVFDFGGHVGVTYYAYKKYLPYDKLQSWTVCDVQAVVDAGRQLATETENEQLQFTTQFSDAENTDILLASGSLQYIQMPFSVQIKQLTDKPQHIIVNLLPAYNGETVFTLQNIGTAFCPYKIVNLVEFKQQLIELGYEVVDQWANAEKSCYIPFHPKESLDCYYGLYLRLRNE